MKPDINSIEVHPQTTQNWMKPELARKCKPRRLPSGRNFFLKII
jgi:hypothetical protein